MDAEIIQFPSLKARQSELEPDRPQFNAEKAVQSYSELGVDTRSDSLEHALRTASLVEAFAGENVPQEALQMAIVHDVFDRFYNTGSTKYTPERAKAAQTVLLDMLTEQPFSNDQIDYCLCLLHDMVKVEKESGRHRVMMARDMTSNGESEKLEIIEMLSEKYIGNIPPEVWKVTEPYIMFEHMGEFLKDTNIEALIIKACELVDNMKHPSSRRESALLQDVLEAESFYAPILEVIGFDGLASALRDEAHQIRLTKRGLGNLVDDAERKLESIEEIGMEKITESVFGGWKSGQCHNSVGAAGGEAGEQPVCVGDGCVVNRGVELEMKYRIKTAGSLASKLESYAGEMPRDLVGYTIVSRDIQQLAQNFADFICQTSNTDHLEPVSARSKREPYFVYGSEEFVAQVKEVLRQQGVDPDICQYESDAESDKQNNGYRKLEVAKVTMLAEDGEVPVEVQFVTKDERKQSRTGEVAHIIYKYIKQYGDSMESDEIETMIKQAMTVLEEMHARRSKLNPYSLGTNERSWPGGVEAGRSLAA